MSRGRFGLVLALPGTLSGLLVLLAACGSFSSTDEPAAADGGGGAEASAEAASADGAPADAGADAFTPCALRSAVLLCADFDEAAPLYYSEGIGSPLSAVPPRTLEPIGKSAPNAMWSDGRAGRTQTLHVAGKVTTGRVAVDLDVFVEGYSPPVDGSTPTVDGPLVRVGLSPHQCSVSVILQNTQVLLGTHCVYTDDATDWYDYQPILTSTLATSRWWHIALDVDYASAQATASIDGKVVTTLGLNTSAKPGGIPFVEIGEASGAKVGVDNVLATAQ